KDPGPVAESFEFPNQIRADGALKHGNADQFQRRLAERGTIYRQLSGENTSQRHAKLRIDVAFAAAAQLFEPFEKTAHHPDLAAFSCHRGVDRIRDRVLAFRREMITAREFLSARG